MQVDLRTLRDLVAALRGAGCVFAEDEARLLLAAARDATDLAAMADRRLGGTPLEHVLGWAAFCGVRVTVDPGVFVPRRRTELLVHQAVALARSVSAAGPRSRRPVVVDLCCGSGAVGAALLAAVPQVELHAADVDPAAVRCARRNLGGGAQVHQGDLDDALPDRLRGRVDVLVANAPYVPTGAIAQLPAEARVHEPQAALDGGADGLDVLRRVVAAAPRWLAPGGHLLVETSRRQQELTVQAFADRGLLPRVVTDDDLGATVVLGSCPGAVGGE